MPQLQMSLNEIEEAILYLKKDDQLKLTAELPVILKLPHDTLSLLKLAEPSFEFWNNPEDSIYDSL